MRFKTAIAGLAFILLGAMAPAHAELLQGHLELRWGDGAPGVASADRFTVTLVTDDGVRHPLDPDQALRAAGDLYSLAGRRVAMEVEADTGAASRIAAIVPVDDLVAGVPLENAVTGTTPWITIMCKFSDVAAEPKTQAFFESQYGNGQGQLDQYWREVSYNKVNLTGSHAYGWFTLPQPRSFYVTGSGNDADADLDTLFDDCTAAADAAVDFASVPGGVQGINMMFNDALDCCAWGGGKSASLDGVNKVWSTTWNPPFAYRDISPLTHEMGHGYGLPHANNSDGDSNPYDNPWDVMSDAYSNATSNATYGRVAKHVNTYHRDRLGWIDAARKVTVQAGSTRTGIRLDRASLIGSTNPQMIVVRVPGQPASRYTTVEVRKRTGYYEGSLAGDAVIIHAVDTSRREPAWSVDASVPPANTANNEGSMFKPGETWTAPGNAFRIRVNEATADGFRVSVCGAPVAPPRFGGRVPKALDRCDGIAPPPRSEPPTPPSVPRGPFCPRGKCYSTSVATAEG